MTGLKKIFIYYLANLLANGKFETIDDVKSNAQQGKIIEFLSEKYPSGLLKPFYDFSELNKEIKNYDFYSDNEEYDVSEESNGLLLLLDLIINFS